MSKFSQVILYFVAFRHSALAYFNEYKFGNKPNLLPNLYKNYAPLR